MEGIGLIALAIAVVLVGFFVIRQSKKKGRWGIGIVEHVLSGLRRAYARDPSTDINRAGDVGRMDMPEMRLQGR